MRPARHKLDRALLRESQRADDGRDAAILRIIRLIPRSKTAAYSAVAAAAGYPLHHRLVVRILRQHCGRLNWHRVTGAGGQIRLQGEAAFEQRFRLEAEGVKFRGSRIAADHILSSEDLVCLALK